jgi:adenine-specific DNA methylase
MLKRLIEVALPLKEISEQSAHEKTVRSGHISNLHLWWARRPLAACRAAVFASLLPDPDDPDCPKAFRKLVMEVLSKNDFKPKNGDGSTVEDTPRGRCLEFIKHLVKWENSNDPEFIDPARKLIAAAHKVVLNTDGDIPKVLDPFAGGGAIPLEALRLGCEAHAVDLNPVAHLIELCTLVYPQRYGQPDSRPVPDYIKRLVALNKAKKKTKTGKGLFEDGESSAVASDDEIVPNVEISETEYRKNPLAADLKYWGHWIASAASEQLDDLYPSPVAGVSPVAYLWARTVQCPNPSCNATIPLYRSLWLCKKKNRTVALCRTLNKRTKTCDFTVVEGKFDFDPDAGTTQRGQASCPFCQTLASSQYLQNEGKAGRIGQQMMAVISSKDKGSGRHFREPKNSDLKAMDIAAQRLSELVTKTGNSVVPNEPLKAWSGVFNAPLFGMDTWGKLFSPRQLYSLATFASLIKRTCDRLSCHDDEYAKAVAIILSLNLDRLADLSNTLCTYEPIAQCPRHLFGRQALPMVWDYAEGVPPSDRTCSWLNCLDRTLDSFSELWPIQGQAKVAQGSATRIPYENDSLAAVVTDPPYYDAVPYSDLSDFFYVWLKRCIGERVGTLFNTPLTPKTQELVSHLGKNYPGKRKTASDYEAGMRTAFGEIRRVLLPDGISCVMFAHKTTTAWESLIAGLLDSGMVVSASWPFHTEMKSRLRGQGSAALASSVTLVCRRRTETAGSGIWDDVRQELKTVAQERLGFFWNQGIRGADFFISAIGPALSVFGKYERVTKLSGEEVTVGQFLDEVRSLVTNFALAKILKTMHTGTIDPESRFYVVWKWSYADAKVPADESFKLSQALGLNSETLWNKTGVLEKGGENVQATPVSKRIKIKNLGEPTADGAAASLIDVLHRMCAFREKNDTPGMVEFLGRSGQAKNHSLWLVAQAVSEILPDGEKEKQLMQGLLNQKDGLLEAAREKRLF